MKAKTQYEDFVGTAAADIGNPEADIGNHGAVKELLESRGVDTERYDPIGVSFSYHFSDFDGSIICIDKESSTEERPYFVEIRFERKLSHKEFFNMFKRFQVTVTRKYHNYQDKEIDNELTIDDRNNNDE